MIDDVCIMVAGIIYLAGIVSWFCLVAIAVISFTNMVQFNKDIEIAIIEERTNHNDTGRKAKKVRESVHPVASVRRSLGPVEEASPIQARRYFNTAHNATNGFASATPRRQAGDIAWE